MTITADAIRSGVNGMSAFSRISVRNDRLGKAGLSHCFNRAEAIRANRETIDALKTAALNDPRYSGIQDKVNLVFGGMDPKHAIRAADVKKAFAKLDRCAIGTDTGKREFLVKDLKMRLMSGVFSSASAKGGTALQAEWAFSFKDEWKTGRNFAGTDPELRQWSLHFRELEPMMGMMVDELAARKGGIQNISAEDAVELSWKVQSLLTRIAKDITDSSIGEKHHDAAFAMVARTLANSPQSISSPLAVLKTADEFHEVLDALAAFETSPGGSKFAVENGIAWMTAMCRPLSMSGSFVPFVENHFSFSEALKLDLPPDKAESLTRLVSFEHRLSSGKNDMEHDLLDAGSTPRILLGFPALGKSEKTYEMAASLVKKLDRENVGEEMRNLMLGAISSSVGAEGLIPEKGSAEATAPNGERVRFEWSFRNRYAESATISSFNRVA